MPELRQNYFTKEWVIIATERAKRPEDLATHRPTKAPATHVENCPFCPGNENKTPPEVLRIPAEGNGAWQVRVIGNKFAALSPDIKPTRVIHRSRRSMGGFGIHDVIVESPNHAHATCLMADSHVADVLRAYKARYDALSLDRRIAHITIF
jgi:UDPglucose--hexose-1-phosphate uridylyltransferase